ncbi:MAG TPA: CPBP family glutamic-type intramembrane protease [Terriglobia bacterium]|nr:CPBP family glutamic-type intramembrane protease [Terriglobia bacterium]
MGAAGSKVYDRRPEAGPGISSAVTVSEILAVYAAILLYIWRWQDAHPFLWVPLLAAVLFSQWLYGDTLEERGLTAREFRACARAILPVLLVVVAAGVLYGLWAREVAVQLASPRAALMFVGYFIWCSLQQYLTQSYFHRRLMRVVQSAHLRSFVIGLLFAGAHIPNPVLMAATFAGGIVFAEIFSRHPNIWPLAFVQALAGFVIGTLSPPWIIHGMRVGPGYFLFHPH